MTMLRRPSRRRKSFLLLRYLRSNLTLAFALTCAIFHLSAASDDNPITINFKCRANGCCDQHEWCRFWASMGECQINRRWMNRNCQLACGSCNRPPVRQPFPSSPPLPVTQRSPPSPPKIQHPVSVVRLPPVQQSPPPASPPRPRIGATSPFERCRQLQGDASLSAEVLWREGLISAAEDNSGRRNPLSADKVVRSNIANACVPRLDEAECQRSLCYNLYFRTMDGTCNNFRHPLRGAAFRPYSRLLPPEYDNGLSEPVSSLRITRPTAREANRVILSSAKSVLNNEFNMLLMQFGQFMSHDLAKTTLVPSAKCNVCQNIPGRCRIFFY